MHMLRWEFSCGSKKLENIILRPLSREKGEEMSSSRNKLIVLLAAFVVCGVFAAIASAASSSWTYTVNGSTYSGQCQLNDNNTPRVCVGDLVSGPGVGPGVRFPGPCPVTLTGSKAIMVCPAGKQ
jgi:hypothetical protein